ncbi:alpha/beta hydrolase [Bacteroides sp. 214]|uniref:alpha/beta hydrolase n=1 Tax=Bacteroides sp. 214 TaxID=2302935 RepID=UPI0013D660DC|nr:alpha/beta hydrolase [Bacteroides sp. 214]NDW11689.1 alpha/beta hydrolase [Bacteroides sp. 214]
MKKKVIYGLLITLLVVLLGSVGGGFFLVDYALTPNHRGKDVEASYTYMSNSYPWITSWLDSLRTDTVYKELYITNEEGKRLHAFYVAAAQPTNKTAVIVHGYQDNAIRMLHIGYMFNSKLGYNILLPDLQNHGLSEGEAIQMGWKDRYDVMQWMHVADSIFGGDTDMVVHGISMGAATTMMVAGEELSTYVNCFVEDCGYTSVWDQFGKELSEQFHLPAFPLLYIADEICQNKYGWSFKEASALNQLTNCVLPMFFIHGEADDYVPCWMVHKLYEIKSGNNKLWIVPNAPHAKSYQMYPEEYTERVRDFLEKYNRKEYPDKQ